MVKRYYIIPIQLEWDGGSDVDYINIWICFQYIILLLQMTKKKTKKREITCSRRESVNNQEECLS